MMGFWISADIVAPAERCRPRHVKWRTLQEVPQRYYNSRETYMKISLANSQYPGRLLQSL